MSSLWLPLLTAVLALLLCWGAVTDLRSRIISNRLNAAIALLAPLWWWANGLSFYPDIAIQLGLGLGVFAIFTAMFAIGLMGGGDVKMLGAIALWMPLGAMANLIGLMALLGGAVTVATIIHLRAAQKEGKPEIPYGVAIALAGLWVVGEPYLNALA